MGVNLVPFVRNFFITHEDADAHSIQDGCITAGNHRLLRFDFLTQNIGTTDLNVGSPADHPEWFEKSASHGHFHLKYFAEDSFADNTICTGLHIEGDTVVEIPLPFLCDTGVFRHWMIVAQILFGIVNDGGGLEWVPGRGPVPVGPWGPLSLAEQDILTALATSRLAAQIADPAIGRSVQAAATEAVVAAARQLQHQVGGQHH